MNPLLALFLSFGKVGLISLGGGNSMLKLIEYESVQLHHWVSQEEFARMLGTIFLFPGLTAVKLAALIGYKTAGFSGFLLSILALNLPGLLMTILGYRWLLTNTSPSAQKLVLFVQYGALALLAAATFSFAQEIITTKFSLVLISLTILLFIGITFFNISPVWCFVAFIGTSFLLVG